MAVNQVTNWRSRVVIEQLMTYLSSQEILHFLKTQKIHCSAYATQKQGPNLSEDNTVYIFTYCLILSSLILVAHQSDFFTSGLRIEMFHGCLILCHLIILIVLVGEWKLCTSSLFWFLMPLVTSFLPYKCSF
jgi:hypothetical protein